MGKVILLLSVLALGGCVTTSGSFCKVAREIRPTEQDADVISQQLADGLLAHLETGARLCGWKP